MSTMIGVGSTRRRRQYEFRVAKIVIVVTLLGGCLIDLKLPHSGLSIIFYLFSLLGTSLLPQRRSALLVALLATVFNLAPYFWQSYSNTLPPGPMAVHYVWIGVLWVAAAFLVLDPRRAGLRLTELRTAFQQAPAAMALLDLKGRLLQTNAAFGELSGVAELRLEGQLNTRAGTGLWKSCGDHLDRLLRSGDTCLQFDHEIARHDGTKLWHSVWLRLLEKDAGKPAMVLLQILDLSEQRRAQRALGISESRFRGIIENTAEMILIIDADGTLTYANPTACTVLGLNPKILIGHSPLEYIHYHDRKNFARQLNQSFREPGQTCTIERVRLAQEDQETFLEVQLTGLLDTPGIHGTVATCRVITQHLADQKKLRLSEAKFSSIFHASPDAILIIRYSDGILLDFNTSFTRLLGYTREEAIGEGEASLGLWSDKQERDTMLRTLRNKGDYDDQEVTLVAKNGERINTEISMRLMEFDGELCTLCIGRDITEKRQAIMALRESEAKFARIFSHSPDSIIIIRISDLTILDVNQVVEINSGYQRSQLVGKSLKELNIFDQELNYEEVENELLANGSAQGLELGLKSSAGETIPCLVSASLIEWDGADALLCIAKDHRAQQQIETELRSSEERFRSAFEHAPIGIMMVDLDGHIFKANRYANDILAYAAGDLPGLHISRLIPVSERKALQETFEGLLSSQLDYDHSERRMTCNNSHEIWTNFHTVLLRSPDGKPLYYIVQIADITDMKDNHQRMERMAFYDSLTDLANRRLFSDRLEHAIQRSRRSGKSAALLYLDLDRFKRVNDTLGHESGDELLREVGNRLQRCVRQEDTVARPGGDEFTILLYDINGPGDASLVAEKILAALRKPIRIAGQEVIVTTSIGITILPHDSMDPNILTKSADLAMYRAKDRGRNNYQFFSADMNANAESRLLIENEMHQALKNGDFELYYQPKVSLVTQTIVGVEALLRWQHKERGLIACEDYIPIAEETGFIVEIGAWVIEQACKAASKFSQQHDASITVAVNISARQFRDPQLITIIRRNIKEAGIKAELLELELTETMLMGDVDSTLITLQRLHDQGIKLAIDDFGTGYSSLNYLKRFPIDTIKIDRSFVKDIPSDPDDMTITAAVIAMAHRLNLEVVAEGVETAEQLAFLSSHHCEIGQGYYFSKPLCFDDTQQLLDPSVRLMRNAGRRST